MNGTFTYCPIVKGKLNDIKAVASLGRDVLSSTRPLVELPPFLPTDVPEQVLGRFVKRMASHLQALQCYVDFPLLKPGSRTGDGRSTLLSAFGQLAAVGLQFEPVYGFDRDEQLWGDVVRQAQASGGMLIRLDRDDLDIPDDTIERIVSLRELGLDHAVTDVLIDMRAVESVEIGLQHASEVEEFIDRLAESVELRRVIVAGSCAPKTVSGIQKDSYGSIKRGELHMWARLATIRREIRPIYGDYGVIHPDFSDLTMSTNINGKIRYTQGDAIHIFRGHSLREKDKYEQYRKLASRAMTSSHYQGTNYSFGDRYIADCAAGMVGTGNPGTWVHVDQNHHFSYVAKQVERLNSLVSKGASFESLVGKA